MTIKTTYGLSVCLFLWLIAALYIPGKGFTALAMFGDKMSSRYLPELRALDPYVEYNSYGYDAQYYAQIAMRPDLRDPQLATAVDNIAYRGRRILFCWTANILGFGNPARALQVFCAQNIVCWLGLAFLLLRWFPPINWNNYFRWAGLMFSFGLCFSVRGSLVDGPSLLMIAIGVALVEARRPWLGALVLGISGLGKETNVLSGAVFAKPSENTFADWGQTILRGAIVGAPLAIWVVVLWGWFKGSGGAGSRAFAMPFSEYFEKWASTWREGTNQGWNAFVVSGVLLLISLATQFLFFALRPRWSETWWRIGAAYAILMVFLGPAVWEGYPSASSRILLPMALAFNVSLPRGRVWMIPLLLGNLTFLSVPDRFNPPAYLSYEIYASPALESAQGDRFLLTFDSAWFRAERSRWQYWRWSGGTAAITVHNPHGKPLLADVRMGLKSNSARKLTIKQGTQILWQGEVAADLSNVTLGSVHFAPGDTVLLFETEKEADPQRLNDPRRLAFSLRNLEITLTGLEK